MPSKTSVHGVGLPTVTAFLTLLAIAAQARPGRANGRYPQANQLVQSGSHLVVRTTLGTLISSDAGKSWGYICESAIGSQNTTDPPLAITEDGTLLEATTDGLAISHDGGCSWQYAAGELAQKQVVDVTIVPRAPATVIALYLAGGSSYLAKSTDNGRSFAVLGKPLPDVNATTVEVDASGHTLWVAGVLTKTADQSEVFTSVNQGASWTGTPRNWGRAPYVTAVDPSNAQRLYIREALASGGSSVWVSKDGGATFAQWTQSDEPVLGFALSPDGGQVALGTSSGLRVLARDQTPPQRLQDVATAVTFSPLCLTWLASGLYACADTTTAPFAVARSTDGATFQSLLEWPQLAPLTCPPASSVGKQCGAEWCLQSPRLGLAPRGCTDGTLTGGEPPASTDAASGSSAAPSPEAGGPTGIEPDGSSSDSSGCSISPASSLFRAKTGRASSAKANGLVLVLVAWGGLRLLRRVLRCDLPEGLLRRRAVYRPAERREPT